MKVSTRFKQRLRDLSPSVFALWGMLVVGAALAMSPAARSLPLSWDDQVFQPGAMMLIESLRLHRSAFLQGLRESLFLLAVMQLLLLLARSRVTAAVVDSARGRSPRPEILSQAPAYLAITFFKLILLGICAATLFWAFGALPPLEGTMPPRLVVLYSIVGTLGLFAFGLIGVFTDVFRVAIFYDGSALDQLRSAWATAVRHCIPLLLARAIWIVVGLGTGALTFMIATRPLAEGTVGAFFTFVFSQILVAVNLGTEVWWLSRAEEKLSLYRAPE